MKPPRRKAAAATLPRLLVLLAGSAALAGSGSPVSASPTPETPSDRRMLGGTPTDPTELGVVLLLTPPVGGKGMSCSGTIVSDKLILTAGHCVSGRGNVTIVRKSPSGGTVSEEAAETFVHPDFYRTTTDRIPCNDVALIRCASPLTGAPAALKLDFGEQLDSVGTKLTVCGFGRQSATVNATANVVNSGNGTATDNVFLVPAVNGGAFSLGCTAADISMTACQKDLQRDPLPGQVCELLANPTAACFGDSGGPSFAERGGRKVLQGVVSWGASDCSVASTVFTKVS